jgi:uncharacterized membrane protein (DUF485 family)
VVDHPQSNGVLATIKKEDSMADAVKNFEVAETTESQVSLSIEDKIAASKEFQDLMAAKRGFIVPAFVFFVVYYFALPVLVGYAPELMSRKVIGQVNLAYLFALSQFFVAWLIAWLYMKAANSFDRMSNDIVENAENSKEGK